jgi:hypothetical protein
MTCWSFRSVSATAGDACWSGTRVSWVLSVVEFDDVGVIGVDDGVGAGGPVRGPGRGFGGRGGGPRPTRPSPTGSARPAGTAPLRRTSPTLRPSGTRSSGERPRAAPGRHRLARLRPPDRPRTGRQVPGRGRVQRHSHPVPAPPRHALPHQRPRLLRPHRRRPQPPTNQEATRRSVPRKGGTPRP